MSVSIPLKHDWHVCAPTQDRTRDLWILTQQPYPLSYGGKIFFFSDFLLTCRCMWVLRWYHLNIIPKTSSQTKEGGVDLLLVMQCSAGSRRLRSKPCRTERTLGRCTSCNTNKWDWKPNKNNLIVMPLKCHSFTKCYKVQLQKNWKYYWWLMQNK